MLAKIFLFFYRLSLHAMNCKLLCPTQSHSSARDIISWKTWVLFRTFLPELITWSFLSVFFGQFERLKSCQTSYCLCMKNYWLLYFDFFFYFIDMITYQCFLVKSWDPLSVGHIIWKVWWLNFFVFFLHPLYSPSHPAAVRTTSTICLRGAWAKALPTKAGLIPRYPNGNRKEPTLWFTPTAQRMHAHTNPTLISTSHHRSINAT